MNVKATQRKASPRPVAENGVARAGPDNARLNAITATLNLAPPVQRLARMAPNRTGIPDHLKTGVEAMSGMSLDDVRVHRNSPAPAQLNAHAFARGREIHLAPGQDHHLPHEAWHVVQQAQGRVKPTMQMKASVPVNDETHLETEADVMGAKAASFGAAQRVVEDEGKPPQRHALQRVTDDEEKPLQAKSTLSAGRPVVQRALTTYDQVAASTKNKKFSWAKLRTDTDEDDEEKQGIGRGLGVATTTGKQLKTKIYWKPVDSNSGEATGMDANILGPDHKLGSVPQSGKNKVWNKRRVQLGKAAGEKYIAGHLLNNNLGGPGDDPRNLTAIPATANTLQSGTIEEEVKRLVNQEHHFIRYVVDIDYTKDTKGTKPYFASKVTSTWNAVDDSGADIAPNKSVTVSIPSPSSLKGGETVDISDASQVLDMSGAGKAHVDKVKDIVLNNDGYIKIALKVQNDFIDSIKKLRSELSAAKMETVKSEDERQELLERIEILEAEIDDNVDLLDQTEAELEDTAARLEESEQENELLSNEIARLKERYKVSKRIVADLRIDVEKLKKNVISLEFDKLDLLMEHGSHLVRPGSDASIEDVISQAHRILAQFHQVESRLQEQFQHLGKGRGSGDEKRDDSGENDF